MPYVLSIPILTSCPSLNVLGTPLIVPRSGTDAALLRAEIPQTLDPSEGKIYQQANHGGHHVAITRKG